MFPDKKVQGGTVRWFVFAFSKIWRPDVSGLLSILVVLLLSSEIVGGLPFGILRGLPSKNLQ